MIEYKTQATPLYENSDTFKKPEFVYDNPTTISKFSADLLYDVPRTNNTYQKKKNNFYSIRPSNVKKILGPKRASAKSRNSSRFINVDGKNLKIIKETMLG